MPDYPEYYSRGSVVYLLTFIFTLRVIIIIEKKKQTFFQTLKIERSPELAQIAMIIFVISHDQADVSRGFLINTNVIDVTRKSNPFEADV